MIPVTTDYITGLPVPDTGSEANRQIVEKLLVTEKGFSKSDIRVDEPITVIFKGEPYVSSLDLVVFCREKAVMAFKCVAGSIGSYEREILSGARLIYDHQIPFAISTDGKDAVIMDTLSGKKTGQGMDAVPDREGIENMISGISFIPFPENKKEREMIIFRSFNIDKTNR